MRDFSNVVINSGYNLSRDRSRHRHSARFSTEHSTKIPSMPCEVLVSNIPIDHRAIAPPAADGGSKSLKPPSERASSDPSTLQGVIEALLLSSFDPIEDAAVRKITAASKILASFRSEGTVTREEIIEVIEKMIPMKVPELCQIVAGGVLREIKAHLPKGADSKAHGPTPSIGASPPATAVGLSLGSGAQGAPLDLIPIGSIS